MLAVLGCCVLACGVLIVLGCCVLGAAPAAMLPPRPSACGPREDSESPSAAARASGEPRER